MIAQLGLKGPYLLDESTLDRILEADRIGNYAVGNLNEKGEFMPPNKYTVFIEVAREHGTYQILKQVVNCNNKEESFTLTPNVEVSAANVAFQKSAETK